MGKRVDRREFLKTTFLGTGLLFAPYSILDFFRLGKARQRLQPSFPGKGSITYDKNCFVINGERRWVTSGAIHYFRIPRALWRDRLLKARMCGLNCIETVLPWNFHEPEEGKWMFSGDNDIESFLEICKELGMFVILRPGPYVCAEWDFGGFPPWLEDKPQIEYRTNNKTYLYYADIWFSRILPIIVKHQITRGGPVILIQNENEYLFRDRPGGTAYLEHINRTFRAAGIEIPIIVCNFGFAPIADTIECFNGWDNLEAGIQKYSRSLQADAPSIMLEFWSGWFDAWGSEPPVIKTPRETAKRALSILSQYSMLNYYVFHGGTNFGFFGGRTVPNDQMFITTSYDYDTLLSEAGQPTEKFYRCKLVHDFAREFAGFFTTCDFDRETESAVQVEGEFKKTVLKSPQGKMLFLRKHDNNTEPADTIVTLPNGTRLTVSLADFDAIALPLELRIESRTQITRWLRGTSPWLIDYCNGQILGIIEVEGTPALVVYGQAATPGVISVNGNKAMFQFPRGEQIVTVECNGLHIVALNFPTAQRSWFRERELIVGPALFDGATEGKAQVCFPREQGHASITILGKGGKHEKSYSWDARLPALPVVKDWEVCSIFPEIEGRGSGWRAIDAPRPLGALNHNWGYSWYKTTYAGQWGRRNMLFFSGAADRLHIFVNGRQQKVWGRGKDATMGPVPVYLRPGRNELVFLVDNLGRMNFGMQLGERKGIYGPVFLDAQEIPIKEPKWRERDNLMKLLWWTWQTKTWIKKEEPETSSVEFSFRIRQEEGVHLSLQNIGRFCWIFCNNQLIMQHCGRMDSGFQELSLDRYVHGGRNWIKIYFYQLKDRDILSGVRLYRYTKTEKLDGAWYFKSFDEHPRDTSFQPLKGASRGLAFYRSRFTLPQAPVHPIRLSMGGMGKGQIYLNGHNIGRYWQIGPQEDYYLPEPWLERENVLMVFEEQARTPGQVALVYDPHEPLVSLPF